MTRIDGALERRLTAAFAGGDIRTRELRLTEREADYLRDRFQAVLVPLGTGGDKSWYKITLRGAEH